MTNQIEPDITAIRTALDKALAESYEDNTPHRIVQKYVLDRDGKRYDKRDRDRLVALLRLPYNPNTRTSRDAYINTRTWGGVDVVVKWCDQDERGHATYREVSIELLRDKSNRFDLATFCKENAYMLIACDLRNAERDDLRATGGAILDYMAGKIWVLNTAICGLAEDRDDMAAAKLFPAGEVLERTIKQSLSDMIGYVQGPR